MPSQPSTGTSASERTTSAAPPARERPEHRRSARLRLRLWLRRWNYARLIRRSGLFDAEHYLAQVADPGRARRDPIRHFLAEGAAAGLDPNPLFDTSSYAERHPDSASGGKNPLVHFLRSPVEAGLNPGPLFCTGYYLSRYDDVRASGMNPLAHYLARGAREGRVCHPGALAPAPLDGRSVGGGTQRAARFLADARVEQVAAHAGRAGGSHVLVVDHRTPTPDQDSGSVRMIAILRILRDLGHEVTFVSDSVGYPPRYEEALRRLGIDVIVGLDAAVTHLAGEGLRYRFALLSRAHVLHRYLPAVRAHAIHATVVYDTLDLHWVRVERAAELSGDPALRAEAERLRTIERLGVQCSDRVLAITAPERDRLLAELPGARVEVLPNIHACRPSAPPFAERSGLAFIGGFEHDPNVDAVRWFVSDVLPLVRHRLPGAVLHVIGSKPPPSILRLAREDVRIHGYVPDPTPLFDASRVFVAPLRYGAGMKGKIGHAMSLGLPVVTTEIGAEGMELVDEEHALLANGAEALAAAVVRLHEDERLWARLARSSVRHVQERFSEEVVRAKVAALFPREPAAPLRDVALAAEERS